MTASTGIQKPENAGQAAAACFKPACPYYPNPNSELVCPYFMLANNMGASGGKANWAGLASLIMGIISISMCWLSLLVFPAFIFIILSILAIVFGGLGMRAGQASRNGRLSSGAGLILGILALVFTLLLLFMRLIFWGYYY